MLVAAGLTAFAVSYAGTKLWSRKSTAAVPPGMVWLAGGEFTMGTDSDRAGPTKSLRTASAFKGSRSIDRSDKRTVPRLRRGDRLRDHRREVPVLEESMSQLSARDAPAAAGETGAGGSWYSRLRRAELI